MKQISTIIYKLNKIKQMPLSLIAQKLMLKGLYPLYYEYKRYLRLYRPIRLERRAFKGFIPRSHLLVDAGNKEHYVDKLIEMDISKEIIEDADRVCEHIFNLLGSGDKFLGKNIPWNKDFKSGYVWENNYYKKIKIEKLYNGSDVKVPWELSRFQHIFTLGKAYWITGDEKYALEFRDQVKDWIMNNPAEMSVNWTCAMDVAIRSVNWIMGYNFFRNSNEISKEFWEMFNESLYTHGQFIFNNLENKGQHTGNHYLSDICGLIWLGIYFNNLEEYSSSYVDHIKWSEFGITELEREMFIQTNDDGTNYEASTSYHRLVTELFLVTAILCIKNNIVFSNHFITRLEKMCEFIKDITKPNNLSPIVGDSDNGRFLIFSNYYKEEKNNFCHILSLAGEFFDRDDFRYYGVDFKEDSLWVFGRVNNVDIKPPLSRSSQYKKGGFYILKNKDIYCCIRCGELSFRGQGGHSHNDQLSFELNILGHDIFIDPGTYVYTPDYKMRNYFRKTNMHNVLNIEGFEQNDFNPYDLFTLKEQTHSKCILSTNDCFIGQHTGYFKKLGITHQRQFQLSNNKIIIIDSIIGGNYKEKHNYQVILVLDENVMPKKVGGSIIFTKQNVILRIKTNQNVCMYLKECFISKSYGTKIKSSKVIIESRKPLIEWEIEIL